MNRILKWIIRHRTHIGILLFLAIAFLMLYIMIEVSTSVTNIAEFSINQTNRTIYTIVQESGFSSYIQSILIYLSILLGLSGILIVELSKELKRDWLSESGDDAAIVSTLVQKLIVLLILSIFIAMPFISIYHAFTALSDYAEFNSYGPHALFLTQSYCRPYLSPNALNYTAEFVPNGSTGSTVKVLSDTFNNNTVWSCRLLNATAANTSISFSLTTIFSLLLFLMIIFYVALKLEIITSHNK